MKNKSLKAFLRGKKNITPTILSKIIFGIACTMKKMHENNIFLFNLSSDNILLDDNFEPKISNIQYFKFKIDESYPDDIDDFKAAGLLMIPEYDSGAPNDFDYEKMNVFFYGFLLYEIFTSEEFLNSYDFKTVKKIRDGFTPRKTKNIPDHYWEIIDQCWKSIPEERLSFDEITNILTNDKFALDGTNLDELHEYQNRMEKNIDKTITDPTESLKKEINDLKKKIKLLESKKVAPQNEFNILDSKMISNLRTIREISSGASGKVLEVAKEEKYALKVMHTGEHTVKDFKLFIGEYEKLNLLQHPNIVHTYGIFLSDSTNPPSILLEFCPQDLRNAIKDPNHSNVQVVIWIYQIIEGMKYVHKCQIIHRDLKPSNILIGKDGKIRISDFGISKLMTTEEQSTTLGAGTQKFMAPEILREEKYDEKADVYSFGVLVYFMISGGEMPKINIIQIGNGKKAEIPSSFAPLAKKLIDMCWNYQSKDRPSFEEILSLLENNKFKLFELSDPEIKEIQLFVNQHKEQIPNY